MIQPGLVERIYEAALAPELWPSLLRGISDASSSASATMLVFDGPGAPRWRTTPNTLGVLEKFAQTDIWRTYNRSPERLLEAPSDPDGFNCVNDIMTPEQLARDEVMGFFREEGLAWQIGTAIPMPGDQVVVFTFERRIEDGRHSPETVAELVELRPHLGRAGMIAAQLGLERARGALETLEALGMPAALLDGHGRLLEANAAMDGLIDTRAGGRVVLGDPTADAALERLLAGEGGPRSLPLRATLDRPGRVAHLAPLGGAARDIFGGGLSLLMMSVAGARTAQLDFGVLRALFDLSPAEARLATALASGTDLTTAAAQSGIKVSTARSYLEQIFRKTGCHRQGELVALLVGLAGGATG